MIAQPADGRDLGSFQVAGLDAEGRFETVGLPPGRYVLFVFPTLGWHQVAVSVRGRPHVPDSIELGSDDLSDVELRMSTKTNRLEGTVRGADGHVVSGATIYLFPRDPSYWSDSGAIVLRLLDCRSGFDGRFHRPGILPGAYYVAASLNGVGEMWRDPERLRTLVGSAREIDLRAGDLAVLDLTAR